MATASIGRADAPRPGTVEIDRLIAQLRGDSRPWEGARLFALVAVVMLAQLRLAEALSLKVEDIRLGERVIVIRRRRDRDWKRTPDEVSVGSVLAEVLSRWIPRCGGAWLFPNLTRCNAWNASSTRNARAYAQLSETCSKAGVEDLGLEALRASARPPGRLAEPGESPFSLGPDDMRPAPVPIGELRAAILALYPGKKRHTSRSNANLVFDELDRMGVRLSSELGDPGFIDRFAASAEIADLKRGAGGFLISHLQTVCGKAMELGLLDVSPFVGRSGFMQKARERHPARTAGQQAFLRRRGPRRPKATVGKFDPQEMEKLTAYQRELVILISSYEPQGCSGPFIQGETQLTSHGYHLKKIAGISEYWRARIDFPVKGIIGKENYHVRIN